MWYVMTAMRTMACIVFLFLLALRTCFSERYYGIFLGKFLTLSHNVEGELFAVDSHTLFVNGFSYNGHSHDAVFWAGTSDFPDRNGFHIPTDKTHFNPLPASKNQRYILKLPAKRTVESIRWVTVWNRDNSKSMGSLIFDTPLQAPQPMAIGPLVKTKHGISTGEILISDTQTILVTNFLYDGTGKDAYWMLSKGLKPNGDGITLLQHDKVSPIEKTEDYMLKLTLPFGYYIDEYHILSIWSKSEEKHYGFVDVPRILRVPPSLRALELEDPKMEELNCEMLNDNLGFEVRWILDGDDIIIYLVGNIGPSEYMALGLSKDDTYSRFHAADAIVAGFGKTGRGFAVDYYLDASEKCFAGRGMCPDAIRGSEDNVQLLKAEKLKTEGRENYTVVKFRRLLRPESTTYDQIIYTDGPQAILWAVGPIDSWGFADKPTSQSRGNILLDFGREPTWNCPPVKKTIKHNEHSHEPDVLVEESVDRIYCPNDHQFRAQLGISPSNSSEKVWYINGVPNPQLVVQRGKTYNFIIEGGLNPPDHHPFYITNSEEGGLYKTILEANKEVEITYAGIEKDTVNGVIFPTAEGRLCIWKQSPENSEFTVRTLENEEAKESLKLSCEPGKPGKLVWTPTSETPNVVYYQSYTARNLGGKIRVVDFCEEVNPRHYLEILPTKGGRPKINKPTIEDYLERESEYLGLETIEQPKNDDFIFVEDSKSTESVAENASSEVITEKNSLENEKVILYGNYIYPPEMSSDKLTERLDDDEINQTLENETTSIQVEEIGDSNEYFPHDDSERSDKYVSNPESSKKSSNQINAVLNSNRNADDLSIKYLTHSTSEASGVSASSKVFPQEFKPQFEGGFVPLVTNPMKEKESVQKKEFVLPSHHQNRPHRPFLYNESVPFHGTFKPGIPDFSGFNISNYSQEDASVIITAIGQNNLAFLTPTKSHTVPRNFPPIGPLPLHLLDRPTDILPRPQRVQAFGPRFQPPQQQSSLFEVMKNTFPHPPANNKPNFSTPNNRGEDLTGVPSQRVYVSMQTAEEKKSGVPKVPNLSIPPGFNRNVPNYQQNKMIYPHSIQRRPDFYEEKGANLRRPNEPQKNFNMPQGFINKQVNQQSGSVSIMNSAMLPHPALNRPNIHNSNTPNTHISNFQGSAEKTLIPQRPMRLPYPLMNVQQRERVRQNTLLLKPFQIRSNPVSFEKQSINERYLNPTQIPSLISHLPIQMANHSEKIPEAFKKHQELDVNSTKELKHFSHVENSESAEIPKKNGPPTFGSVKSNMNQEIIMQKLPFNETLGAFVLSTNLKGPQQFSSVNFQESIHSKNIPIVSTLADKSANAKADVPTRFGNKENNPIELDVNARISQNLENNRAPVIKDVNSENIKHEESHNFNSRPASFLDHNVEKYSPGIKTVIEDLSSSEDSKEYPAPSFEHDHEDHIDSSDSIISDADYIHYNIPFGARLKFPQNGSRIPAKSTNETPSIQPEIVRRPYPVNNANRNSGDFMKPSLPVTSTSPSTISATSVPSTTSTTTDETLISMESVVNNTFNKAQITIPQKEEKMKILYYEPPFSTLKVNYQTTNSSVQETNPSNEMKHIPIIADTLEDIGEPGFIERKNILLHNSNSTFPSLIFPPKVSEDINLPHISEKPPVHDNRTDYSILNHVLTLIGGPPE